MISFALPEHSDAAEIRILNYLRGLLVALTIGFALICDFLLLPPLLIAIDRKTQ